MFGGGSVCCVLGVAIQAALPLHKSTGQGGQLNLGTCLLLLLLLPCSLPAASPKGCQPPCTCVAATFCHTGQCDGVTV